MMKRLTILLFVSVLTIQSSFATTWDEPWAREVIKGATSFVLAKIISADPHKGIHAKIIKTLGGSNLAGTIVINDFYLLSLCSTSAGHGAEFNTTITDSCYFFIKKQDNGNYAIATPTAGSEYVVENRVAATYRHSYHQALVPVAIYEKTMAAIYNY